MTSRLLLPLLASAALLAPPATAHAQVSAFTMRKVAEGVYMTDRVPPVDPADGNVTVIVNERDVVVVDANIAPASTFAVLAEIRKITPKPVRYVINTHSHNDHITGNAVYRDTFPDVEFIGHPKTRDAIIASIPVLEENVTKNYPAEIAAAEQRLAANRTRNGTPYTEEQRRGTQAYVGMLRWFVDQMKGLEIVAPTLTVDDELVLHRGARRIEVRWLGEGNTAGDLVVWLPAERVLITGDLVVRPTPYAFGSPMRSWLATLRALRAIPAAVIVPGHGAPMTDGAYIDTLVELVELVNAQVAAAVARGLDLEATRKAVDLSALRDRLTGGDPALVAGFVGNFETPAVQAAYEEAVAKRAGK